MDPVAGAGTFHTTGDAYDAFMGRYSRPLAVEFVDSLPPGSGPRALDVGCGPGALTRELIDRFGTESVMACDPSPPFVSSCLTSFPGLEVRLARAEALPFDDDVFDVAMAQLVLHFVTTPEVAALELRRVVRPGGVVAACVWDFEDGMEMLRHFWDAALTVESTAPDEANVMRFGRPGEIVELFEGAGLLDIVESTLTVASEYTGFDELWAGFLAGIGPAGSYLVSLAEEQRAALRADLFERVGSPSGPFEMAAVARSAVASVPH